MTIATDNHTVSIVYRKDCKMALLQMASIDEATIALIVRQSI